MTSAVVYARFSSSRQREASIEDQLRVCREWCEQRGYAVVNEYADRAISGRTDDRPAFQDMIAHAGESDLCVVYMMDRFSRDAYDAPIYKKKLRDKGVRVVSAMESMPDGPEAVLIEKLYEGLAVVESVHISQRTRRGMEGNARKLMHNGVRCFGYSLGDDGKYHVNEETAPIVREVYRRRIQGEADNAIARDLASRGVTTNTGGVPGYTFVHNMLSCEKYRGVYTWGDVRVEGGMPRIIDDETWYQAQTVKPRKQRHKEIWRDYPLAGRAFCACGARMAGASAHGHGGVYAYYRCPQKCGVRPVRADWVEGEAVDAIRAMLEDRPTAERIAHAVAQLARDDDGQRRADAARKRMEEAQRQRTNLLKAVAQGLDYLSVKDEISRLEDVTAAAEREWRFASEAGILDEQDFADYLQWGATLTDDALLAAFVSYVEVGAESVTVAFNVSKEDETPASITLDRGSCDSGWLPVRTKRRTLFVAYKRGSFLIRLDRAA